VKWQIFSNHLVHLNPDLFLQSTSSSHPELTPSLQQPMDRSKSQPYNFFFLIFKNLFHSFVCTIWKKDVALLRCDFNIRSDNPVKKDIKNKKMRQKTKQNKKNTVQYSTQFLLFALSEVVNGILIPNRSVPLFWDPSVGVPSTIVPILPVPKGGRLHLLQNVDWLTENRHLHVLQREWQHNTVAT